MKKIFFLYFLFSTALHSYSQDNYFQQRVNTFIEVFLDDEKHELSAHETIEYTNNSPNPIDSILFHLWPNAYKNISTEMAKNL